MTRPAGKGTGDIPPPHAGKWMIALYPGWYLRTVGSKGGHFAIVGPGWEGHPAGRREPLRVPTNLVLLAGGARST